MRQSEREKRLAALEAQTIDRPAMELAFATALALIYGEPGDPVVPLSRREMEAVIEVIYAELS